MTRVAYVNGCFVPFNKASVHIEERGFQFADAVYEVISFYDQKLIDLEAHLDRLAYSAREIRLPLAQKTHTIQHHIQELLSRNRYPHGMVYVQISRGVTPRLFPFPKSSKPSLVITVRPNDAVAFLDKHAKGVAIITQEDQRWARPDIKTVNLLPAILAKQNALDKGVYDTVFIKNNVLTEASSANFWCVFDGAMHTHPKSSHILNGVTRSRFQILAKTLNIPVVEKAFTLDKAYRAEEAFLTSSNVWGLPVVRINDKAIGTGTPGPITLTLQKAYLDFIESL